MVGNIIARRYARSLIEISIKNRNEEELVKQVNQVGEILKREPKLLKIILNPSITRKIKLKIVERTILNMDLILELKNCLKLMVEKSRINIISEFIKEINNIYQSKRGIETATIITAKETTEKLNEEVLAKLRSKQRVKFKLENQVDPAILGGMILRIGDKEYDYSIRGQLQNITKRIETSIQSKIYR